MGRGKTMSRIIGNLNNVRLKNMPKYPSSKLTKTKTNSRFDNSMAIFNEFLCSENFVFATISCPDRVRDFSLRSNFS